MYTNHAIHPEEAQENKEDQTADKTESPAQGLQKDTKAPTPTQFQKEAEAESQKTYLESPKRWKW